MTHFTKLIKPNWRYLGDVKELLKIEQLCRLYQITACNLLKVRECYIKDQIHKHIPQPHLSIGDVLVRDHAREQFRPRYMDCKITKRLGNAKVKVSNNHGKLSVRHVSDLNQVTPLECTVQLIPETAGMAHKGTLTVNPDSITDLQWQVMDRTLPNNLAEIAGISSKIHMALTTLLVVTTLNTFNSFTPKPHLWTVINLHTCTTCTKQHQISLMQFIISVHFAFRIKVFHVFSNV